MTTIDYAALAADPRALLAHAEMIAEGQGVDGIKGNSLAMEIANVLTLLVDALPAAWEKGYDAGHWVDGDPSRECDCERENPYR